MKTLLPVSIGLSVLLSLNLFANSGGTSAGTLSREAVVERLIAPDARPLVQYRALRYLTASTRGGRMAAELVAATTFDEQGLRWEVIAEQGSPLIRRRVLRAALDAEQEGQAAANRDHGALSPANYEFLGVSPVDDLLRLEMKPRRKHPLLIEGALFLDPRTADLVRLEGEPSKRPSFWTRRARIVRDYGRIHGVRVPVAMRSTADVLLVGASSFAMAYDYIEINGQPIVR
jgi:hypothetical protein